MVIVSPSTASSPSASTGTATAASKASESSAATKRWNRRVLPADALCFIMGVILLPFL